ncbi:hypothetical protein [Algoriphagus sp.]|uniref:hypothetical protein n=1 Tax=Algoriphagus sp. TaxID=1872435 RepID=UPI0039194B46
MKARNRSIILVDHLIDANSEWFRKMNFHEENFVFLDPVNLFSELDWTRYEEDVSVINTIYSRLFEDMVMNEKRLVCFWPHKQKFGSEWFELASLCKANSFELELYKCFLPDEEKSELSEENLQSWKGFVHFLIESILEDIQLNEQFDEIATLKNDKETIILFKLDREGIVSYSYAFDSDFLELAPDQGLGPSGTDNSIQTFSTFNELLMNLLKENDLSIYESKFVDGRLEKAYFSILAKEFKTKNLIENWISTYSMN